MNNLNLSTVFKNYYVVVLFLIGMLIGVQVSAPAATTQAIKTAHVIKTSLDAKSCQVRQYAVKVDSMGYTDQHQCWYVPQKDTNIYPNEADFQVDLRRVTKICAGSYNVWALYESYEAGKRGNFLSSRGMYVRKGECDSVQVLGHNEVEITRLEVAPFLGGAGGMQDAPNPIHETACNGRKDFFTLVTVDQHMICFSEHGHYHLNVPVQVKEFWTGNNSGEVEHNVQRHVLTYESVETQRYWVEANVEDELGVKSMLVTDIYINVAPSLLPR